MHKSISHPPLPNPNPKICINYIVFKAPGRPSVGRLYIAKSICKESLTNKNTSTLTDHASRNRVTFHSHPPRHPRLFHPWLWCRQDRTVSWEECTNDLDSNVVFGFRSSLASQKLSKNISTFFSMRILTKSLVEKGLFFFCLVLILSHAVVPERDGMCHKFEQSSWWRFAGHFKFLWHQKSVSLISRQQKPLSSLQGWLSVEKNCFAVCERTSFGPNVSLSGSL